MLFYLGVFSLVSFNFSSQITHVSGNRSMVHGNIKGLQVSELIFSEKD